MLKLLSTASVWLVLVSGWAHAQKFDLKEFHFGQENGENYLYRTDASGNSYKGKIVDLDTNRKYFHWMDEPSAHRWLTQGINQGEFQALRQDKTGNMAAGGGLYISKSALNSTSYGRGGIAVAVQPGTRILLDESYGGLIPGNTAQIKSEIIEELGLDGWEYNAAGTGEAWLVLFKRDKIRSLDRIKSEDIVEVLPASMDNLSELSNWVILDEKVGIEVTSRFKQRFPLISRLFEQNLTAPELKTLEEKTFAWNYVQIAEAIVSNGGSASYNLYSFWHSNRKFGNYILGLIGSYLRENLKGNPAFAQGIVSSPETYGAARAAGITPKELGLPEGLPLTKDFPALFPGSNLQASFELENDFGKKFYESFEFIDLSDMVQAQALGNPAPWTRYDQGENPGLYDRLKEAKTWMNSQGGYGIIPDADKMSKLQSIISGIPEKGFRDFPIVAGGSHYVNGQSYYRITVGQLKTLQANPYLIVESVPEVDPMRKGITVFARHEYPSARTYEKFKSNLSPQLVTELDAAKKAGLLSNADDATTKKLTKKVLTELWVANSHNMFGSQFYLNSISIHPFQDFNGRTMRFAFQAINGQPLILRNWDWDIFMSPAEFDFESRVGTKFYQALKHELKYIESMNPGFPEFYNARAPYAFFFDLMTEDKINDPHFLDAARNFFRDNQVSDAVREKRILELGTLEYSDCNLKLNGLISDN